MERISGKLLCIAGTIMLPMQGTIRLQLQALNGQTMSRVQAGQPFVVQVTVSDRAEQTDEPTVQGLQALQVQSTGYHLTMINGVQSIQYQYQVRIDAPGVYQIGPAQVTNPNEAAPAQTITVVAQAEQSVVSGSRRQNDQPMLELTVDQDRVYVGQKIRATARLIVTDGQQVQVEPFVFQPIDNLQVVQVHDPEQRHMMVDGKGYNEVLFHVDLLPAQAGRIVIPAQLINYNKQMPMDKFLGGFATLFGPRYERKRAYSNAITLEVMSLPESARPAAFIGDISQVVATIEPMAARQYEGMVLRLTIEGTANFATAQAPDLTQLPEGLKYYRSRTDLVELGGGKQRYACEYIVQGMQPGDYEIPPYEVVYFDPSVGVYKTAATASLFITIMPAQSVPKTEQKQSVVQAQESSCQQEQVAQVLPLYETMSGSTRGYGLPRWLILLLLAAAVSYCFLPIAQPYIVTTMQWIAPVYMKRRFFAQIRTRLKQAASEGNVHGVYSCLAEAVAYKRGIAYHDLDALSMATYAEHTSWSLEQQQHWPVYVQQLTELLYAQGHGAHGSLLHKALLWLDLLEGVN